MGDRLIPYIERCRAELMAMLRHTNAELWSELSCQSKKKQCLALSRQPEVCSGITHQLLDVAGFGPGSLVQRKSDLQVCAVSFVQVMLDGDCLPMNVWLYGTLDLARREPSAKAPAAEYLGRMEDFVSMSTGINIIPAELFDLLSSIEG